MKEIVFDLEHSQLISDNRIYLSDEGDELLVFLVYAESYFYLLQEGPNLFKLIAKNILISILYDPLLHPNLHLVRVAE